VTLTGPNASTGEKEFGADQHGAWRRQVERMAAAA
jgi:hypothetical protein